MKDYRLPLLALACFGALLVSPTSAADVPAVGWRSDAQGYYPQALPPTKWSAKENIVWQTPMPGKSYGSPILVGDKIFVPSDPAELLCLQASDGKVVWQHTNSAVEVLGQEAAIKVADEWKALNDRKRDFQKASDEFRKANPEAKEENERRRNELTELERQLDVMKRKSPIHSDRGSGNSTATPISDGKHVYAVYGTGIVACYTLTGERRWIKFIEGSVIGFGHSSSPLLVDGKLIVHFHDLVALNAETGEIAWRTELPARHASPVLFRHNKEDLIVSPAGSVIRPSDGKVILADQALRTSECSAIAAGDILYTQEGKTSALKLPSGDAKDGLEVLWQVSASRGRRTPSPVLHRGLLYGATTEGILEVTDTENGEIVYRKRLDFDGNLYSSVTCAGDYIFLGCTRGTTLVIKAGREYEEVASNKLENYGSNPVFAGQRMYLRCQEHLYCIGTP
ncbi:outer membrane biogenesis protein BamB [Anatilimnocola aggregata]|uniref:Outer membrane biogenesis protein BamB n=1 Tax=Anatilimnocola aggregata TaxID=2528021 RepID=A0A517YKR4_9BACT|nr:PQQ-binding-like beta-propeller repeat protein [Anatilimnocola aggregata]QDU30812.1 outer membrane biogenesis protein BamB [Anatilimnocola aggregata]